MTRNVKAPANPMLVRVRLDAALAVEKVALEVEILLLDDHVGQSLAEEGAFDGVELGSGGRGRFHSPTGPFPAFLASLFTLTNRKKRLEVPCWCIGRSSTSFLTTALLQGLYTEVWD